MVPLLQLPASVANLLNIHSNQSLNFEANILLLIKYLLQLGSRIPSREEFDLTLLRARQDTKVSSSSDGQSLSVVAPAQLPFLAKLCISSCSGLATILLAQNTLAVGLSEALKFLATLPPANKRPHYIFIINVSRQRGTEFCVVVPGPLQARALIEASLSTSETLKENNVQVVTGKIHVLSSHFTRNSPDQDHRCLDLGRFTQVGLLIIVPPSDVLYQQTLERLYSSDLLVDLGLVTTNSRESCEQFLMKLDNSKVSQTKFEHFLVSIQCMPQTLFVLIQDQAHLDIFRFPQLQQYQRGGLASQVVNAPSVVNAPNVLCLQVSSLPYNLQTNKSRIAKGNEIFMETCQYQVSQICSLKFAEFMIIYYSFVCKLKKCNKPCNIV
ncbi:putative GREB1-like protein isoform X2 [Apostichopus japonicus]|uniref:Putative GREB1-like protein isoform X2 n=1 Tax=Stichopus japonicus TaxID=307972 RepID=A0A2G8KJL4_STIJA|nr:putative GREB1-like protein isoform X2 [Apostichopus japonicus]